MAETFRALFMRLRSRAFFLRLRMAEGFSKTPSSSFANDPLFLDLALEALYGLLEGLVIAHFDVRYGNHLPSPL